LIRRITGRDSATIAIPAGFAAGLSMFFYPSKAMSVYAAWKTMEVSFVFTFYHCPHLYRFQLTCKASSKHLKQDFPKTGLIFGPPKPINWHVSNFLTKICKM
jgi:hypothetical protein